MRRISTAGRLLSIGIALVVAPGCADELPTLSGEDRFPPGSIVTTLQHVFEASEFLVSADAFTGRTSREDAGFLMVANGYEGAVEAHVLANFTSFPDTIVVDGENDGDFSYLASTVVATVPDSIAASDATLNFQLWTVEQAWDSATVSWEFASDAPAPQVAWQTPGGTRGQLVAEALWERADTGAVADSLIWSVPPELVSGLASEQIEGLMVTLATPDSRVEISRLALIAEIQPSVEPDTTVFRTITTGNQTFIHTPEAPQPEDVLRVGGLTSDRSLLRIALDLTVPTCPVDVAPACPRAPLDELALNRVELILDPVPVAPGFTPLDPIRVSAWRVAEPDLGELAPLVFRADTASIEREAFLPGGDEPVDFLLDAAVSDAFAREEDTLGLVLLVEPAASTFGVGWFAREPRLRVVYSLPQTPRLP